MTFLYKAPYDSIVAAPHPSITQFVKMSKAMEFELCVHIVTVARFEADKYVRLREQSSTHSHIELFTAS